MNIMITIVCMTFIVFTFEKLAGVTLILSYKTPLQVEYMNLSSLKYFCWKLKISFVDKEYHFYENQFYDQVQLHFDQKRKMYIIPFDIEMSQRILKSRSKKSYLIFECDHDEEYINEHSFPTYGEKSDQVNKFIITLDSIIGDNINFKNDLDNIRILNIKHMLSGFRAEDFELICNNRPLFDSLSFEKHAKFDLRHFANHMECFEALRFFLNSFKYLKVVEKKKKCDGLFIIEESELKNFFQKKFDEEFIKPNSKEDYGPPSRLFQFLCINYTYCQLKNVFLLPITSIHDMKHHLEEIYKINSNVFKYLQNTPWLLNRFDCYFFIIRLIRSSLKMYAASELSKYIQNDLYRPLNVLEYYSNLYNIKKKTSYDPEKFEKIVCDYYNTITCIHNINKNSVIPHKHISNYVEPIKNYNFECTISKAIQINVEDTVKLIRAYKNECTREVILENNYDYFISEHELFETYVFPFENLRKQEIVEIEVIFETKGSERYQISNFLDGNEETECIDKLLKPLSELSYESN